MTNERDEKNESGLGENLSAVGQMIVGGIETVGGILTGNPAARAEGEFNTEVGAIHQEANKNLIAAERSAHDKQSGVNDLEDTESKK